MIKAKRLKPGNKIAIVSLSWGGLGDPTYIHKYEIAKERLEHEFELQVVCMPHALKGSDFVAKHPELRARDLMDAFLDPSIDGIICAIGGDDTIRTLPYIDFEVIRSNPKVFMGYSDSTVNHFMMYKAGVMSFYGPSIMSEFGEYVSMYDYTKKAIQEVLFQKWDQYSLLSSPYWSDDYIPWEEANRETPHTLRKEIHGYEVLNGTGVVKGHLLGGCIDVFTMVNGTSIWPSLSQWNGAILFYETSEDKPAPDFVLWTLRNLAAQGILKVIKGIIVGKPQAETYYEEYKHVIKKVIVEEEHLMDLPVIYNINFGHAKPIGVLPYGIMTELNCEEKTIRFIENATID